MSARRDQRHLRRRRRRRGLSLVEALISLMIAALLLVGVGAAYQASASAIDANDRFFRATQAARVSVNQIMDVVRKCQSGVVESQSLQITTDTGEQRTYALNGTDLTMTFTPADADEPQTYRLASNVKSLKFDTDNKSIAMTITIAVNGNQITLCSSAFPRRTMTYND